MTIEIDGETLNLMKQALIVADEMRTAQKLYFKTRSQDNLIASKRLEAALDIRLAELRRMGL